MSGKSGTIVSLRNERLISRWEIHAPPEESLDTAFLALHLQVEADERVPERASRCVDEHGRQDVVIRLSVLVEQEREGRGAREEKSVVWRRMGRGKGLQGEQVLSRQVRDVLGSERGTRAGRSARPAVAKFSNARLTGSNMRMTTQPGASSTALR